MKFDR